MKKYYLSSWSITIATILFISGFEGYLYFGIPHNSQATKIVIFISWLVGIIGSLAITIVFNMIKRKQNIQRKKP